MKIEFAREEELQLQRKSAEFTELSDVKVLTVDSPWHRPYALARSIALAPGKHAFQFIQACQSTSHRQDCFGLDRTVPFVLGDRGQLVNVLRFLEGIAQLVAGDQQFKDGDAAKVAA